MKIEFDDATLAQIKAGQPKASTWLSANAGSGKTRVLTDRVARLLLSGVKPQHILCLTYTKAAASEMQNRLFKRLGRWTMLDDTALRQDLAKLGEPGPFTSQDIDTARTLFASAIETPGGLKIQTIHSFCSSILRQFPLEAGINPQFTEQDDAGRTKMMEDIIEAMAETGGSFDAIVPYVNEFRLLDLLSELAGHSETGLASLTPGAIWDGLGLRRGYGPADLARDCFTPGDDQRLIAVRDVLLASDKSTDQKNGALLAGLDLARLDQHALPVLEKVFVVQSTGLAKEDKVPTKAQQVNVPFMGDLNALMHRIAACRQNRMCMAVAQRSEVLVTFAQDFLVRLNAEKARLGVLDFDDLILKTRNLLSHEKVAAWILYKLDGGIDHILVDEAQDTSPLQWDIIKLLTQEFTSGDGAREGVDRTIFVVGDKKQSIYSFQGADPSGFDKMRETFTAEFEAIGTELKNRQLKHSFRSSQAILQFTDEVFNISDSGLLEKPHHAAFKDTMPGRVDIWPTEEASDTPPPTHWTSPVDEISDDHPERILAQRIATKIKALLQDGELRQVDDTGQLVKRPIQAGDFLILVRGRLARLYGELHRACKAADIPLAGADRLVITSDLAVQDVLSLLKFLALPEDSLSLAEVLKSPLFGWTEQDLYDLAQGRKAEFLWREMEGRKADFPATHTALQWLRDQSEYNRPFELIQQILIPLEGRKNLVARLGTEAEEALDALLAQALIYDSTDVPSLTGFLDWMQTDATEVKRQMDAQQNQVRIMTVHGAKGLEAPIVILPDTGPKNEVLRTSIVDHNDALYWMPSAGDIPDVLTQAKTRILDKERLEKDRLLYVAMTRAESWLIVAEARTKSSKSETWNTTLRAAADRLGAGSVRDDDIDQDIVRFSRHDWDAPALDQKQGADAADFDVVNNRFDPVSDTPIATIKQLNPSLLKGAKTLAGEGLDGDVDALAHGTAVHQLLEVLPDLPKDQWPNTAFSLDADATALAEAVSVLEDPLLSHIFDSETLAEVNLSAMLPDVENSVLQGAIDRLIVDENTVTAIDFKTNQVVPETADDIPLGLRRQMAAYAKALTLIFPNHTIETAILWTKTRTLMPLPHHIVREALQ